jgi:hypothetical protein
MDASISLISVPVTEIQASPSLGDEKTLLSRRRAPLDACDKHKA